MRLERVVPAVAIVLFLSTLPAVASEGGPSATVVAPAEGATIGPRENVSIEYTNPTPGPVSGYLTLDGAWAGSFGTPISPAGTVRIRAQLNATGFASGAHLLSAHVYTNATAPVDAPPVSVVLDHPPAVSAVATYDLDARVLRVSVGVEDEGPTPPTVNLSERNVSVQRAFVGTEELALPVVHGPGSYTARLRAVDARNQSTQLDVPYTVLDRPAALELLEASYAVGGFLTVDVAGSDADGGIRSMHVWAMGHNATMEAANGSWRIRLGVEPQLGEHAGEVVAKDAYGGQTTLPFTFVIGGPREVIFERTIRTTTGSYENVDLLYLPRVHDAVLEICVQDCASNVTYVGAGLVVAMMEARTASGAQETCISRGDSVRCEFDTRYASGWPLDLAWKQQASTTITVRVSGIRV